MRIGIDLRSLEGGAQHRGIGRYATQLIEALSRIDNKNEYVFFTSHAKAVKPVFETSAGFKSIQQSGKKSWTRKAKFIRTLFIKPTPLDIDKYSLDVFFHMDIQQPIKVRYTPVVSVLFDLIPFIYKDLYQHVPLSKFGVKDLIYYLRLKSMWHLAEKSLYSYKKSAAIVSISEHSKRDLISFLPGITPDKIHAIPLAAGEPPKVPAKAMQKYKLKNFLFYVGGADPRKGLVSLVKQMEGVWDKYPGIELVLAGKEITDPNVPEAARLARAVTLSSRPNQIKLLGFITDNELAWLYKNAAAFVFPSSYEGFGLPILEAMQAGCPVIAYNNSSIPEVAGDAAILVNDGEDFAPSINKLLGNKTLREKLVRQGYKQESEFTWEKTAKATLKVIMAAGGHKK